MNKEYDICVVGSGIAGSALALVLSKVGCKVCVIERGTHPRFAIGESTVPLTSLFLRDLASTYDVPELEKISHYLGLCEIGCTSFPKQHFYFGLHEKDAELCNNKQLVFETPTLPIGPDTHILRSEVDAYLASKFTDYGIDYFDNTEVVEFIPPGKSEFGLLETRDLESGDSRTIKAKLLVDASGHASFLAKQFALRDNPPELQTNTRTLFNHFKHVADFEEVMGGGHEQFRFRRDAGTMHHCFDGGWMWCIPFDNDTTSVGLMLDRDKYPLDTTITPEEEFRKIIGEFPTVKTLFKDAVPTRPFVRSDRVQFTSKSIVGDGYILTPHASGFVDALFSSGILLTLSFIWRFAPLVKKAVDSGDFNTSQFKHIEPIFKQEVKQADRLVSGLISSFRDFRIMKQYWRLWLYASNSDLGHHWIYPDATHQGTLLYGSCFPEFIEMSKEMLSIVLNDDKNKPGETADKLKGLIDPWQEKFGLMFEASSSWDVSSEASVNYYPMLFPIKSAEDNIHKWLGGIKNESRYSLPDNSFKRSQYAKNNFISQADRYKKSTETSGDYHEAYHRIVGQRLSTFSYDLLPKGLVANESLPFNKRPIRVAKAAEIAEVDE